MLGGPPLEPPPGMHTLPTDSVKQASSRFINSAHLRIHPHFVAKLAGFDALSADDPRNEMNLSARFELHVAPDGAVAELRLLRSSGVEDFDRAVLESVRSAAPFEAPPTELLSADRRVHVRWDFARDGVFACSPMYTALFLFAP